MIAHYSAVIRAEAEGAGFPCFTMDGDFDRQVTRVVAYLTGEQTAGEAYPDPIA